MSVGTPALGDILGGKFRVERVLGQGGMGVVIAAHHLNLDCSVALKFMHATTNQGAVDRFLREARAVAKLTSEHVCRVLDSGAFETGVPYIAMELMDGADLGHMLRRRGPLPIPEAVDFVLQACEPLAEAHAKGIIHRDLKPDNLFVVKRRGKPFVKVLDFGIAKSTFGTEMTGAGAMMGTPHYMSPEQFRSAGQVDARADIWSLGVILYELVTGRRPFTGDNVFAISAIVDREPHAAMATLRDGVPASLEAVVDRCLAKGREDRYPDIVALLEAFAAFTPGARDVWSNVSRMLGDAVKAPPNTLPTAGFEPTRIPIASAPAAPVATTLGSSIGEVRVAQSVAAPRRRPMIGIGAAVAFVILAVAAFVGLHSGGRPAAGGPVDSPPPSATPAVVPPVPADATERDARPPDAPPPDAPPLDVVVPVRHTTPVLTSAPRPRPSAVPATKTTTPETQLPASPAPAAPLPTAPATPVKPTPSGFDLPNETFERKNKSQP